MAGGSLARLALAPKTLKGLCNRQSHGVAYRCARAVRPVRPSKDCDGVCLPTGVSDERYLIEHTPKESTALAFESPAVGDRAGLTPSHLWRCLSSTH